MKLFKVTDQWGVIFYVISPSLSKVVERFNYNVKEEKESVISVELVAAENNHGNTELHIIKPVDHIELSESIRKFQKEMT